MALASAKFAKKGKASPLGCSMREDAGQALIELALVVPLLTLIFVGAAEVGRIAYAAIEVNNAARAGVAYASQTHTTADSTSTTNLALIQLAATQEAPDVQGMTVAVSNTCSCATVPSVGTVTYTPIACLTAKTTCPSPGRIMDTVQVNTTATIDTAFHFPGIPNTITLRGQASMNTEE